MKSFVLDNSVAICWFLKSQSTPYSEMALRRVANGATLAVPGLWISEFINVISKAVQMRALDSNSAEAILMHAKALPILPKPAPELADVFTLTERYRISAYDATYLELALRLQLPLATADARLAKAAKSVGVFLS
ncbi:MAG: PIN domain-containing protein [Betaproteobacteria bacterium]|nr:PIN domain-containing protein [Betaproteobacteria bacterium]